MARKKSETSGNRPIENYEHKDKQRLNNPPVGLVSSDTDQDTGKQKYSYDPHLDPQLQWDGTNSGRDSAEEELHSLEADVAKLEKMLADLDFDDDVRKSLEAHVALLTTKIERLVKYSSPYLNWAGKAEHTSFEIPTVSLHVHERIDPRTIIEAARKKNGGPKQGSLFEMLDENPPLRHAIEFYKHSHNWSNRLIAGDSLLVMNSLLEKEGMAGKLQMIYLDPPYGIKYGSNFQPFVNKRDVRDGKAEDLTQEPETLRAFRDTWELGIHSYLTYLRDRLLLARELLHESGSCFVQIGDENIHLVRLVLDEVFQEDNFCGMITFQKTGSIAGNLLGTTVDFLLWYAKTKDKVKYHQLYLERKIGSTSLDRYDQIESPDLSVRRLTPKEVVGEDAVPVGRRFQLQSLFSDGQTSSENQEFEFNGSVYRPKKGGHWKTTKEGLVKLATAGRVVIMGTVLRYKRYLDDFPVIPLSDRWESTQIGTERLYVVQTASSVVERCILMTTDPGDLVFDPTCGSGTAAYAAEKWGRRWIACDTSRVAITLAKQRLMTDPPYAYYELAQPGEGVGSGFIYKTVPHITLKSIANNPDIKEGMTREKITAAIKKHAVPETLYDQPLVDKKRVRVTGPFTVEAVPAPVVKTVDEIRQEDAPSSDASVARGGETLRQAEWRDELFKTGVRGKGGQRIEFSRLEPLPGCRWLHADAETKGDTPQRVVISFGPEHAPLGPVQVDLALQESQRLMPKPAIILFASFQFDPEAAKDIDETHWPGVSLLRAEMNKDILTDDLKKKRASNESFWLIGQPDITLTRIAKRDHEGKWQVEVHGFDYYNTISGKVESGGTEKIAMWMLDTDYDGWSVFPRQVFFPMADEKGGWARLAKNLKAEIDEELIEQYRGTVSLPFAPGEHNQIAVKIIDDRGIESLKIMRFDQ